MRARLRARGYRVLDAHDWPGNDDGTYDVVTVLNVVDRHPAPRTLLRDVGEKLAPGGRLVLAAVLPFSPYVEYDSSDHLPKESLNISGASFEEQATSIITEVLPSLDYKVERWTKLPYMCEGDSTQSIYWLNDALFVARKL
ncbi:protein-L-histidine N-pros-methyltransferase [Hyalella azteca]|uniref:Protein-L-histidine N-pros-methyltransferase n=1 Tax=Hyalella azteca TaxID=294128 RepID=A0A8B7N3F7_HYAAZ|nr:protein-L-histidine N-pros-methyltransferase [Hyalella azteca]